uniref:Uncharacterized protein LOC104219026 n=1 Tax=Nicotiana sylvestris TaxID=4096 RepID=A0A1U7W126_NICSY|nr:PREDICTED: uncharacterized protein LOC104219026 [Nicotiana sylvestris]
MATDFKEKIRAEWKAEKKGTKMYELVGKLHRIKHTLQQLNKDKFNELERKADEAMMRLQKCQGNIQKDPYNTVLIEEEKELSQECSSWCKAREQYLRQKSKIQWLKQGDMNTKFFHSMMKARRNSNRILAIDNTTGQQVTDLEEIAKTFIAFYEGLLGTKQHERDQVCSQLVRQGPTVSESHSTMLIEDFIEKEVKAALWAINGDKAPGPDGFGSQFFKDGWEIVGMDVVDAVMEFLKN